jgi:hypothetical protein
VNHLYRPPSEKKKDFHTRCHSQKTQRPGFGWKDRFAEALAREIVIKGRFEKRDEDELELKIRKMLDQYERISWTRE